MKMVLLRYFLVGGVAAIVDIAIFSVAVKVFRLDWFLVALCSFLIATAVNYALSIRYVFRSGVRFNRREEVSLVFLVSGLGLVVNQGVLWSLIEVASLDEALSKVMATGAVFFWNYATRRLFIFKGTG